MQGNDPDIEIPGAEELQLHPVDLQPAPPVEADPDVPGEQDQLMNISTAAYTGCPGDSTISILLRINQATAVALANTGSTDTFMDLKFAQTYNIPLTATKQRTVKVAGGGILSSTATAYNCQFSIQGHKFTTNFKILELQGSDIILGVNWFKQHNHVTFDFLKRQLMIGVEGKVLTLKDHLFPTDKLLISSEKCNKLIAKGASGYWLCSVQTETVETEEIQSPVSEPVSVLLHQFQDIFQPPVGLPPPRDCDHQIPQHQTLQDVTQPEECC